MLERVQRTAAKTIRGMQHIGSEDSLRELGSFSLEEKTLWVLGEAHQSIVPIDIALFKGPSFSE